MVKDILIVRFPDSYNAICDEAYDEIVVRLNKKFEGVYNLIVFSNENDTNKTEFEIIKYNG